MFLIFFLNLFFFALDYWQIDITVWHDGVLWLFMLHASCCSCTFNAVFDRKYSTHKISWLSHQAVSKSWRHQNGHCYWRFVHLWFMFRLTNSVNLIWSNSSDFNPVDYKVWSVMQWKVCKGRSNDVDKLRCMYPDRRTGSARYWYGSQVVTHASSCTC